MPSALKYVRRAAGSFPAICDSGSGGYKKPMDFDVDTLRTLRLGQRLGHTIHFYEETDSTNTRAREAGRDGAPEGTLFIAERQTAGRGRLGRTWESPPRRNLYLSVLLRPPVALEIVPQLTLVAGLSTAEAVREWVPRAGIKWPNDVLIDGRKVSGILTEMEASQGRVAFVVVGIGVNLNLRAEELPPELRDRAAGVGEFLPAGAGPIDRPRFADRLLSHLDEHSRQFVDHGFAALRARWNELSLLAGRHVRIDSSGTLYEGVVVGIHDDGTLHLRGAAGEARVVAGDVTVLEHRQS